MLISFLILLAYTIFKKVKNPELSFINCIPFMDEFSSGAGDDMSQTTNGAVEILNHDSSESNSDSAKEILATAELTTEEPEINSNVGNDKTVSPSSSVEKKLKTKTSSVSKKTNSKKTVAKIKQSKGDNIKKINGIGPTFEKKLNSIGINKFEQIAAWSVEDVTRIDEQLELSGRPQREEWVQKASILASEKDS